MPDELVEALSFAFGMFWEILWALIPGFFLSAVVQAGADGRGLSSTGARRSDPVDSSRITPFELRDWPPLPSG
jgi:hypothetical protein